jgi:hypothetical protein
VLSKMMVESRTRENPRLVQDGDGPLLAAAIAATLVEYQRYADQRTGHEDPNSTRANWRTVVRMEQLRGRG